jgi:hypothetical protein
MSEIAPKKVRGAVVAGKYKLYDTCLKTQLTL